MNKKGQAAMEFLMTYGWAILVVIAAIAALAYFGVLDPSRLLPEKCEFAAGMTCVGGKATFDAGSNAVTFPIKNNLGFAVNLTDVQIAGTTGTCNGGSLINWKKTTDATWSATGTHLTLQNNDQAVINMTCPSLSTGKFDDEFTIYYKNLETTLTHPAVGVIRGQVP